MSGLKTKKQYYKWNEFEKDTKKIAEWARKEKFKSVYGIPRGGLILAVKLSHLLDIPQVLYANDITPNTLVVDDIVDSGATMDRFLFSFGTKIKFASIFSDAQVKTKPNFSVRNKKGWVIFPWETDETSRYDGTWV